MRKAVIALFLLAFIGILAAQAAQDEAIQSLDNAKGLINQKNYVKAQDEINYALSKLSELLSEELVKYIPDAPDGFRQDSKNAQGLGQMGGIMGSANAIAAKGDYTGTTATGDDSQPSVHITISVGGMMGKMASLAAMGQMYGGGSGTNSKSIRVAGYAGTMEYSTEDKNGKLSLQVGDKVSVVIEGDNLANGDVLKTFAGKIDLAKLEKAF